MKTSICRLSLLMLALGMAFFSLTACSKDKPKHSMRFYVETSGTGQMGTWSKTIALPNSGISFTVGTQPVILEVSVDSVELMRTENGQLFVAFHFDDVGSRELYRQSVSAMGRRIVLEVNGAPVGARQFDGALPDGMLYMYMDIPDDELDTFVLDLKASVEAIKRIRS